MPRNPLIHIALAAVLLAPAAAGLGQDVASLTGVVTDASGAIIPDTVVTLTNPQTGVKFTTKTDSRGSYRFSVVPPNQGYVISFEHAGFSTNTVKNFALSVGITQTRDAKLQAGTSTEIEVTAGNATETVNTTDASIGNNIDPQELQQLPILDRTNPSALFTLQPGITLGGATTGARVDQDQVTLDGLDVNDLATGQAFGVVGNAPVDSVQEFRGTVGGFTVDNGPGGGGQFQLVTRNGTNTFHGDLNEYHRDTATAANTWFNNNFGLPRTPLIRNQFGGALGGPIKKDKLFFFFDFNDSRIVQSTQVNRVVPLNNYRQGNIAYIRAQDSAGHTCSGLSTQQNNPNCIAFYSPAQVKALDPAGIGEDPAVFALINSRYPQANNLSVGDGVNTGGFAFTTPTPDFMTNYVLRLDYNITSTQKLFARATVTRQNRVQSSPAAEFPGDPAGQFIDRSHAWVVGHTWQIGTNKFNQASFGETIQDYYFPLPVSDPNTPNLISFQGGVTNFLADAYQTPINAQGRRIPIPQLNDTFQWQKGAHNLDFGGFFKFITSSDFTKLDYNTASIGLGGQVLGLQPSLRPADARNAGSVAPNDWDSAFTAALGRVGAISEQYNYDASGKALPLGTGDNRNYRYYQYELYAGDIWKVTPALTVSYGVNWQYFSVPYETNGLESVATLQGSNTPVTFDQYFGARLQQSAAGKTGNTAVPLIQYVLGGKANNGPGLYNPEYHDVAPRLAFSYNPSWDRDTVFNGSVGLVYDRTVINAVQYQQDQHSYLFQQSFTVSNGISTDPTTSLIQDPRLGAHATYTAAPAPPSPKAPYLPFVNGNVPFGLQNGQAFNTQIDGNLRTPYSIVAGFGMQHQFKDGFLLKMNYAGRFGRRLLAQADANQIIDFRDPASGELLSNAFAAITTQVRQCGSSCNGNLPAQPWFENLVAPGIGQANGFANNTSFLASAVPGLVNNGDFADFVQAISGLIPANVGMGSQFSENTFYTNKGFSSYNGLLVTLHKNMSHGLQFDVNYTFSHSIDNVSLIANQGASAGYGFICDVVRPRLCRGNSDFDATQITSADFVYSLPFGQKQMFASSAPRWLDEVIGGWQLSGLINQHSGYAYSLVSNAFVAGYANDAPPILIGNPADLRANVHKVPGSNTVSIFSNTAQVAADFIGPVGFNIGSRNIMRGPGYFNMDAGLAKTFAILPDRGLELQFRADFFNVLNHPNFSTPGPPAANTDVTNGQFGQITSTTNLPGATQGSRIGQFSLRLEF